MAQDRQMPFTEVIEQRALERDLVAQLSPSKDTQAKAKERAMRPRDLLNRVKNRSTSSGCTTAPRITRRDRRLACAGISGLRGLPRRWRSGRGSHDQRFNWCRFSQSNRRSNSRNNPLLPSPDPTEEARAC